MRFSILQSTLLALSFAPASFAQTQRAATLTSKQGPRNIVGGVCINFSPADPIYDVLYVRDTFNCALFDERNCEGKGNGFGADYHEVEKLLFKSIACVLAAN